MLIIAGTVPLKDLPLISGEVSFEENSLVVGNHRIPCTQGTAAMISAALATTGHLKGLADHRAVPRCLQRASL